MKMRLSFFGFVKDIDAIADAGYDCIEMHYREIVPMSEGEFREAKKKLADSPLTAEVFNNPLPLDRQIISPDFSLKEYREHMRIGAERAAELGARFCNFGNGRTRSLPENASPADAADARKKICDAIVLCCELHAPHNITVLLEPLGPAVSTFVLTLPEAIAMGKELGCPNLKTFVDLRWFLSENRPVSALEDYADQILHIHIDNPLPAFPKRPVPRLTDEYDYAPFINVLKKICYKGIISCEANHFDDFAADAKGLVDLFRHFGITPYREGLR